MAELIVNGGNQTRSAGSPSSVFAVGHQNEKVNDFESADRG
jgi:hypothetical protein